MVWLANQFIGAMMNILILKDVVFSNSYVGMESDWSFYNNKTINFWDNNKVLFAWILFTFKHGNVFIKQEVLND